MTQREVYERMYEILDLCDDRNSRSVARALVRETCDRWLAQWHANPEHVGDVLSLAAELRAAGYFRAAHLAQTRIEEILALHPSTADKADLIGAVHTHNNHYIQCGYCDNRMHIGAYEETPDRFHPVTVRVASVGPEQEAYTRATLHRGAVHSGWVRVGDGYACSACAALPQLPELVHRQGYGCDPLYVVDA